MVFLLLSGKGKGCIKMKKLLGTLGLAFKAGAVAAGTNNVLASLKSGKAKLVILTADASANTKKVLTDKAGYRNIKTLSLPFTMDELANAFGKNSTSSAAITDDNFVNAIYKHLPENIPDRNLTDPDQKTNHGGL